MIKFNSIPPTKSEDVEFLASFREELDGIEFDEVKFRKIGIDVGRQLIGNMSADNIDTKTAVQIGMELGESHDAFQGWDAEQSYVSGVVNGIYDEASAVSMRRGQ